MYSAWIPQNIQKRVFLYILQQLSLFSGIDLPNLEQVSYNNIHLRDVSIDPEKVSQIPGLRLRHGVLHDISLKGSVKDGALLEIKGVDLVAAPKVETLQKDLENASASLAQSSADLASTILLESQSSLDGSASASFESPEKGDTAREAAEIPQNGNASEPKIDSKSASGSPHPTDARRGSSLGGVMTKAIDMALSKLQVRVADITVKLIIEPTDLIFKIDEIVFSYQNGLKLLSVKGVRVMVDRPLRDSGIRGRTGGSDNTKTGESDAEAGELGRDLGDGKRAEFINGEGKSGGSSSASSSESDDSDSDSDSDGFDEEEMGSLHDSMVFTHEEASSIYMSATSQTFADNPEKSDQKGTSAESKEPSDAVLLLFIDKIDVSFQHVSPLSNLKIDIHTINVAAVPLLPTVSIVLNSLTKLFKLSIHQLRKSNSLKREESKSKVASPEIDQAGNTTEAENAAGHHILEKIFVNKLEISLTSALLESGSFASFEDELNIALTNFTLKLKDENLSYGGLETFEILRYVGGEKSHVFSFESTPASANSADSSSGPSTEARDRGSTSATKKADIRFEYSKFVKSGETMASELTILISRPGKFILDAASVNYFSNFSSWLSAMNENYSSLLKNVSQLNAISSPRSAAKLKQNGGKKVPNQIILQTASFEAELHLTSEAFLTAFVFPLSYDKLGDLFVIPRLNLEVHENEEKTRLLTVSDTCFHFLPRNFESFHYSTNNSAPRKSSLKSSTSLVIDEISGSISKATLSSLIDNVQTFMTSLLEADDINCLEATLLKQTSPEEKPLAQPHTLINSIYSSHNRLKRISNNQVNFGEMSNPSLTFEISIHRINFTLSELNTNFGGLHVNAEGIKLLRPSSGLCGHIMSVEVERSSTPSEVLVSPLTSVQDFPMFQFRKKGDERLIFEVVCRGFEINFFSNWVKLFSSSKDDSNVTSDGHEEASSAHERLIDIRLIFHNLALGVVPGRLTSKLTLLAAGGSSELAFKGSRFSAKSSLRDIRVLLVDEVHKLGRTKEVFPENGFVDIGLINLAHVGVTVAGGSSIEQHKSVEYADELSQIEAKINIDNVFLDVCADSAHTLLQTMSDLKEPVIFKPEEKYRTRMNEGFTFPADIFDDLEISPRDEITAQNSSTGSNGEDRNTQGMKEDFLVVDEYYSQRHSNDEEAGSRLENPDSNESSQLAKDGSTISVVEGHFIEKEKSPSHQILPFSLALSIKQIQLHLHDGYDWKSTRKSIKKAVQALENDSLQLAQSKRSSGSKSHSGDPGSKAPKGVKPDSISSSPDSPGTQSHGETKFAQTLFQSIYIEKNENMKASNLIEVINAQVHGEEGAQQQEELDGHTNVKVDKTFKDLRLKRSHSDKVSAECRNLTVNVKTYPDAHVQKDSLVSVPALSNQVEVSLDTIDVKDNVVTSTWNKMLTFMNSLGERENGASMLSLSITNVRPDSRMPYSESIIAVKVLPLRLFIDQDTLGFVARFFGFRDSRFGLPVDEIPFIQKLTIDPLRVKFDYKPKSIDYAGIRSGNNAELANFFILDGSDLKLKRAMIYGAHGFPKIGRALGEIYGPYIQKYQLGGLLSGLSPVKSIMNVSHGMRELVTIPIQEYKRDGRVLYGIQKGSLSFAKSTTNEILRLGVKLASGTQVILENSEEYFGGEGASARGSKKLAKEEKKQSVKQTVNPKNLLESSQILKSSVVVEKDQYSKPMQYIHSAIEEEDSDPEMERIQSSILALNGESNDEHEEESSADEAEKKLTSLYSNQPANAKEGLQSAYKAIGENFKGSTKKFRELRRELKNADTIQEQLISVAKGSPVILIRPLIGGTEALMKTLIGISNGIDASSLQESRDKYRTEEK